MGIVIKNMAQIQNMGLFLWYRIWKLFSWCVCVYVCGVPRGPGGEVFFQSFFQPLCKSVIFSCNSCFFHKKHSLSSNHDVNNYFVPVLLDWLKKVFFQAWDKLTKTKKKKKKSFFLYQFGTVFMETQKFKLFKLGAFDCAVFLVQSTAWSFYGGIPPHFVLGMTVIMDIFTQL